MGRCKCVPCLHYFQGTSKVIFAYAINLSSIFYSKITVINDTSKQIKQRLHIGKIFALWHLAVAITSKYFEYTYVKKMSNGCAYDAYSKINSLCLLFVEGLNEGIYMSRGR